MKKLPAWAWIGAVLGAGYVLMSKNSTGNVTGNGPLTAGIARMAQAIAKAEGFNVPNAIPTRANNPGDLKLSGYPTIGEGISVFPDVATGWQALYNQLDLIRRGGSRYYKPTMTIAEMSDTYSGDKSGTWGRNVAAALGVPTSTTLDRVLA